MTDGRDVTSRRVRAFYERHSFPGYEQFETLADLREKAWRNLYTKLVNEQLPFDATILDAGCGTGQLTLFLASLRRRVIGADMSSASLRLAHEFKLRRDVTRASLVQMNLFSPALRSESFDYVFCNGVLHHTADAAGGFRTLCQLLKKDGYIIVGLYNRYGRLLLHARRMIFKLSGNRLRRLDYFMRRSELGDEKKDIWFADQYQNPYEDTFTVDHVLQWFDTNGIEYVNSIPKILVGETLGPDERLFDAHERGTALDHLLVQLKWIVTESPEGGFFLTIGRKR